MKIAILGTGGVGGYFGGKMAKAGYDVTFLAKGEHLKALQFNGLKVISLGGDFHVNPVQATDKIKHIGKTDLIILGVKAWQIKEIAKELKEIIHTESVVLPLQNGILAADELQTEINRHNIIGGLCRIISKIESPGIINHFGVDPVMIIGELDNSKTNRILDIKDLLEKSGIPTRIPADIHAELWKKFINICVSGLVAITRSTYGEIRELPEIRKLMHALLLEIYLISQKAGIVIEPEFVDKTMSFIDSFPYDSTPSLARDVWDKKPSEIEYQNGTVVRLGEKYNVATPVNSFVYSCILPMELRARRNNR
jgi:2-dehydropantoate 2-reductase